MCSQRLPESRITPHGETTFEHVVRRLRLSPDKYTSSAKLKAWVRRNKDHKYVPTYLLVAWHLDVDDELFGRTAKATKPAA